MKQLDEIGRELVGRPKYLPTEAKPAIFGGWRRHGFDLLAIYLFLFRYSFCDNFGRSWADGDSPRNIVIGNNVIHDLQGHGIVLMEQTSGNYVAGNHLVAAKHSAIEDRSQRNLVRGVD